MLKRRNQAALLAYALVPLPDEDRETHLHHRLSMLRTFMEKQRDHKMGWERRGNEQRVYRAAIKNLAANAGIEPHVLTWRLDLNEGDAMAKPRVLHVEPYTLTLSYDGGRSQIAVAKAGKTLKSVPVALKKNADAKALLDEHKASTKKMTRFIRTFEDAMIGCTPYDGDLLQQLVKHPMIAPIVERLVWIGPAAIGFVTEQGRALRTLDGKLEPIAQRDRLTVAHVVTLEARGVLAAWRRECLRNAVVQPFRQVFREHYVPTEEEQKTAVVSRFDGLVIDGRRGAGIFIGRGWRLDEGALCKGFADEWVAELGMYNPSHMPWEEPELQIGPVTMLAYKDTGITSDDARIMFSECMRDVDLAVSVAILEGEHDSREILDLRRAILESIAEAKGWNHIRFDDRHAVIHGQRAVYRMHLAGGSVHLESGRQLALKLAEKASGSDLHLPFDDEPVIGRLVATMMLLGEDVAIKDRSILAQISEV